MPEMELNGARLHFSVSGIGPETVVFAHGLLWDHHMFDPQIAALQDRYRCIAVDFRGQGRSEVTAGGYDMDTLTADLVALIETLGCAPCHFVGLSMGGFVGLRLAARHPQLVRSLTLLATSADAEPADSRRRYRLLRGIVRWLGVRPVLGRVMCIMFGAAFLSDPARADERHAHRARLVGIDKRGAALAAGGVIDREPVLDELRAIRCPVLILHGDQDQAIAQQRAQQLHARLRDSRMELLPETGHTPTLECPQRVNSYLRAFLLRLDRKD